MGREESQIVERSDERRTALFWVVTGRVVVIHGTFRMGPTVLYGNVNRGTVYSDTVRMITVLARVG
jgi:hypothetical protein